MYPMACLPVDWDKSAKFNTNKMVKPSLLSPQYLFSTDRSKAVPLWESGFVMVCSSSLLYITKTPTEIYWKFNHQNLKFSDKNFDIFHISAQNIDYGYSLEPPHCFWAEIRP